MVNVSVGVLIMLEGFFGLRTAFMVLGCLTSFNLCCLWYGCFCCCLLVVLY